MDAYGPPAPKKSLWDMLSDPQNKPIIAQGLLALGQGLTKGASAQGYKPSLMDAISSGVSDAASATSSARTYQDLANAQTPEEMMKVAARNPEIMKKITIARAEGMFNPKETRPAAQLNWEYVQSLPPGQQAAAMAAFYPQGTKNGITVDPETGALTVSSPTDESTYDPAPLASKFGVPPQSLDTRGLSKKDSSMYAKNTRLAAEKRLQGDDMQQEMAKARTNKQYANQFQGLMDAGQETGGWRALPIVGAIANKFDPELNQMKSIQDKLTPSQRAPGSGATSDFDAQMFANSTFGPDKPKESNEAIIQAYTLNADQEQQRQQFLSDYLSANGHLNGADTAWLKYANENPIFDPASPDKPKLNKRRKPYQEYFGSTPTQSNTGSGQPSDNDPLGIR